MIFGIGIDNIEVDRVRKQLEKNRFKEKIFSPAEIEYCDNRKNFAERYAARFAAKEAFLKAIGTGWQGGLAFNEIEVLNDKLGKPVLKLYGKVKAFVEENGLENIHVSLTHLKNYASAIVIIEK